MLMKKGPILLLCTMISLAATSQTVDDAKKMIYYERYKSAWDQLQQIVKADAANAEAWYLLAKANLLLNDAAPLQNLLAQTAPNVKEEPFYQVAYGSLLLHKGIRTVPAFILKRRWIRPAKKIPISYQL